MRVHVCMQGRPSVYSCSVTPSICVWTCTVLCALLSSNTAILIWAKSTPCKINFSTIPRRVSEHARKHTIASAPNAAVVFLRSQITQMMKPGPQVN